MKQGLAEALLANRAPAKINLSLHVIGRRDDGYHELESLVAFAGVGDGLTLQPCKDLSLQVDGPAAASIGALEDNLVLRAARNLRERVPGLQTGEFRLMKRLPVAAGIGGGSADAAAALRLLARLNGLSLDHPAVSEAARITGADVPVCLQARARVMRGVGDVLGPAIKLPPLFPVLVNPGVALETAKVFAALGLASGERPDGRAHPAIPSGDLRDDLLSRLAEARNDLEAPARAVAPAVGDVLDALRGRADLVLVDTTPLLVVGDAMTLTSCVDAVVLVMRGKYVRRPMLRELGRVLAACPAETLGFIVTGEPLPGDDYGYGGYRYGPKPYTRAKEAVA
jgi:4-diphosphocytidyl-2-C-methyl-D-erythritol kinase